MVYPVPSPSRRKSTIIFNLCLRRAKIIKKRKPSVGWSIRSLALITINSVYNLSMFGFEKLIEIFMRFYISLGL